MRSEATRGVARVEACLVRRLERVVVGTQSLITSLCAARLAGRSDQPVECRSRLTRGSIVAAHQTRARAWFATRGSRARPARRCNAVRRRRTSARYAVSWIRTWANWYSASRSSRRIGPRPPDHVEPLKAGDGGLDPSERSPPSTPASSSRSKRRPITQAASTMSTVALGQPVEPSEDDLLHRRRHFQRHRGVESATCPRPAEAPRHRAATGQLLEDRRGFPRRPRAAALQPRVEARPDPPTR